MYKYKNVQITYGKGAILIFPCQSFSPYNIAEMIGDKIMEIKRSAVSGTLESSDIMITLQKNVDGIVIDLDSTVYKQFGDRIKDVIIDTLQEKGIKNVHVIAHDRGALDCTIKARVQAAIVKSIEGE